MLASLPTPFPVLPAIGHTSQLKTRQATALVPRQIQLILLSFWKHLICIGNCFFLGCKWPVNMEMLYNIQMDIPGMRFITFHYSPDQCLTTMPNSVISCSATSPTLHGVTVCVLMCADVFDQKNRFSCLWAFCFHAIFPNRVNEPKPNEDHVTTTKPPPGSSCPACSRSGDLRDNTHEAGNT